MNQPGFHGFSSWPGGLSRQLGRSTGFAGQAFDPGECRGFGVHSPPVFWRLQEGNHPKRVCDSVIHPNLNGPYGI